MKLNTTGLVNVWDTGIAGSTTLNAEAGVFTVTGGSVQVTAPSLAEAQSTWYNGTWWKAPTYGSSLWFLTSTSPELSLDAGVVTVTGGDATFSITSDNVTLDCSAGSFVVTGGLIKSSVPLPVSKGEVQVTGGSATLQIEFTSEEFLISNDTTFDGVGITYGVDVALNTGTGEAFTVVSRVDVDTVFLDGIFGAPPQQYSIQKVVATVDLPSVVELRFNGTEWVIVDITRLGL